MKNISCERKNIVMRVLNRSAVVITPNQRMLAWLRSVDTTNDDLTLADLRDEPSIYLVPECVDERAFTAVLKRTFQSIFEEELEAWYTDPSVWPEPLSFRLFQSWFDVSFHSVIADTSELPLVRE